MPQKALPRSALPLRISGRIGNPVCCTLEPYFAKFLAVSGKVTQTLVANGSESRLAKPEEKSDSWIITGIRCNQLAKITGTVTKPPLENTT